MKRNVARVRLFCVRLQRATRYMQLDLNTLRSEIADYLEENGFVVFHGYSRLLDDMPIVFWDVDHYPDYRKFLHVARKAGADLMVYHQREFTEDHVDSALIRLEEARLPRDPARTIERRLREMRAYNGFTCALELSFEYHERIYLFELRTEWYEELSTLLDEMDASTPDDDDDESTMSGYFSRN